MDTIISVSSSQLKQNDTLQPFSHPTGELFKKRNKLLKEKTTFAEEEKNMWEHSKAILAQNIDDEENLKRSHQACKGISKQLHRNAKGMQLIEMRLESASKLIKTIMDTVRVTGKINDFNIENFTARFEALKIRSENDLEALQEKLAQSAGIDNALVELQNSLNRLLRHKSLEERAQRLREMRDNRERILKMEYEELLNRVTLLKSNLEIKDSANQKLQQQSHKAEAELENILSHEIEDLDEVMVEEEELQQQMHACSQEYDEAMTELSKLDEENEKILDKERMLDETVFISKTELENLTALKTDDPEIISLQYKNVCENLQAKLNENMSALQDEVKRVQTELNFWENELDSLMVFLGEGQHDWLKKIEDAITTGRHLDEMITAERKASAALRNKRIEIDIECNRLEMETNALVESNSAEMLQYDTEISDIQNYLEKLITEKKEETKRYEVIRCAAHTNGSAKHECSKDGMEEVCSFRNGVYIADTFDFGEPSSVDDFKQTVASRSQRLTTTGNVANTLFDKANFGSGILRATRKFGGERAVDSEKTGKVPSDINISQAEKADDTDAPEVTKRNANVGDYYPLPPSAFGSPLSTNDSPDVTTDCEISGSELDQSVWSDFSSVVK